MKKSLVRIYLMTSFLTGILALGFVFYQEPSLPAAFQAFEGAYRTGFRKGVVLFLTSLTPLTAFFGLFVLLCSYLREDWFENSLRCLERYLHRPVWFLGTAALLFLAAFISGQLSLPADYIEDPLQQITLVVTRPVFIYGFFLNSGFLGLILFLKRGKKLFWQPSFIWIMAVFLGLMGTGILLHRLGYGLIREPGIETHFDFAGNPLLGYQVILALIGTGMFAAFQIYYRGRRGGKMAPSID